MPLTAGEVIQPARDLHPQFSRDRHPDRVCLDFIEHRQRTYFKELADVLKDRLSRARTLADTIAGALVGVDASGVAYFASTGGDGFAVAIDAGGTPYLLPDVISLDPYADGFVLPETALQIVDVYATLADSNRVMPVHWMEQRQKARAGSTPAELVATVNGFRLLPLKNPLDGSSGWDHVESVTVVWIDEPAPLTSLASQLAVPTIYGQVLTWDLTAMLARRERTLNPEFPADLGQMYGEMASAERRDLVVTVPFDHRVVKERRFARNR